VKLAPLTGNRCECASCGKRFTGLTAFDDHRVWLTDEQRGCLTTEQLANRHSQTGKPLPPITQRDNGLYGYPPMTKDQIDKLDAVREAKKAEVQS